MVFIDRSDRFLVLVGTAPVHFSMQGIPSGRIRFWILYKAINALFDDSGFRKLDMKEEEKYGHSLVTGPPREP